MDRLTTHPTPNERVILLCVLTACLVALLRCFTQQFFYYDPTIQLQAAYQLLSGQGLTTYATGDGFLIDKTATLLTHFPAGFSLYLAAMMSMGLSPYAALSIYGLILTILGWWGWGRFMVMCCEAAINRGGLWLAACFLLAVLLPITVTPKWGGTDLAFWACVPWFLFLLSAASKTKGKQTTALYGAAGALAGICILMRYASAVLVLLAALVLVLQTWPRLSRLFSAGGAFAGGLFVTLLVQFFIFWQAGESKVTPGGVGSELDAEKSVRQLFLAAELLPTLNYAISFWLPERLARHIEGRADTYVFLPFLLFLLALPALVIVRLKRDGLLPVSSDPRFLGSLLIIVLPLMLTVSMIFGSYEYVGDRRYYLPLVPLVILLMGYLASPETADYGKRWNQLSAILLRALIVVLMAMGAIRMVYLFVPGAHGKIVREKLADTLHTFPSFGEYYGKSPMNEFVLGLVKAEPDYHILTNFENYFWGDKRFNQARIERIPYDRNLEGKSLSGPLKILIVAIDQQDGLIYTSNWKEVTPVRGLDKLGPMEKLATFDDTATSGHFISVQRVEIPEGKVVTF